MVRWVQFFLRVAETGSFSKSAKICGVGQPAVSKGILALEDHLGAKLFNRNTRNLSLTEEGAVFYRKACRVLESFDDLMALGRPDGTPAGVIKLSCPLALGAYHIIPALRAFTERYPKIQLDLRLSDAYVDLAGEGIDLVVRVGELLDRRMVARKIGEIPRVVVGSKSYFANRPVPKNLDDLKEHQCIIFGLSRPPGVWTFRHKKKAASVRVHGNLKVDSLIGLRSAVLSGLGIGLAGRILFEDHLADGELEIVLKEWTPKPFPVHLVFLQDRHMPRRLRLLIDYLCEAFSGRSWLARA